MQWAFSQGKCPQTFVAAPYTSPKNAIASQRAGGAASGHSAVNRRKRTQDKTTAVRPGNGGRMADTYGIFGINVDFSRNVQSGFFLRKKPLEGRAFGLQYSENALGRRPVMHSRMRIDPESVGTLPRIQHSRRQHEQRAYQGDQAYDPPSGPRSEKCNRQSGPAHQCANQESPGCDVNLSAAIPYCKGKSKCVESRKRKTHPRSTRAKKSEATFAVRIMLPSRVRRTV